MTAEQQEQKRLGLAGIIGKYIVFPLIIVAAIWITIVTEVWLPMIVFAVFLYYWERPTKRK